MSELDDLRAALVGQPSDDWSTNSALQRRLREFIGSGQRAEVLSLLDLLSGPLALPDHAGLVSPHANLILSIVRRFHEPDVLGLLERAEAVSPTSARSQLVRSVFEIAALNEDERAVLVGLAMAERLVRDNVPMTGLDDPLYWLERSPVFPSHVLTVLQRIAAYPPLRDHCERVRLAYAAGDHGAANPIPPSFVSADDIRRWADTADPMLMSTVVDRVEAIRSAAGPLEFEAVVALPAILVAPWAAWWVEAEVLNGGYNQYFWNSAGMFAYEAAEAFTTVGSDAYAEVHRSAIAAFLDMEPDWLPYRRDGSLESFSASYQLRTFDDLDAAFMAIYNTTAVTDILIAWLTTRIEEVITGLGLSNTE